jgi:hypothetical protein
VELYLYSLICFHGVDRENLICLHGTKLSGNIHGEQFLNLPWIRQLVAGLSTQRPRFAPDQSMLDLWWARWFWERFFSDYFGFGPRQNHSTKDPSSYFIFISPAFCNLSC